MKKLALTALAAVTVFSLSACGSEPAKPRGTAGGVMPAERKEVRVKPVVEVPASVKGKWKGVVIVIEDKDRKSTKEAVVKLGEKYRVPASDMTVEVKTFLPAFVMQGTSISSESNEPSNPAAQVLVMEGGSEIFAGWLFARYPTTHAFSHPRFAITLKEGAPI